MVLPESMGDSAGMDAYTRNYSTTICAIPSYGTPDHVFEDIPPHAPRRFKTSTDPFTALANAEAALHTLNQLWDNQL
ncbi:MAG: hypothetical protein EHM68_15535 [Lysobacterales bacterium]|nr:MAG: hypothetical protein EHM68_15535 [Xanthomonadales bacterium]